MYKKLRTNSFSSIKKFTKMVTIGTHNGTFHADEALAVYILKQLKEYKEATIIRSRDLKILSNCDIIVDVGAEYNLLEKKFDHHQRGFNEVFNEIEGFNTKLSSAGLIWKHFGEKVIQEIFNFKNEQDIKILYFKIYKEFLEAIDANDNGINEYEVKAKSKFKSFGISLPSVISGINPRWNEAQTPEVYDSKFEKASEFIGKIFFDKLDYYGKAWLPAKNLVYEAVFKSQQENICDGKIVVFDGFLPWKEHLYETEKEMDIAGKILYVLYPDSNGGWRVQAVSESHDSFASRKALPEAWRGLRDGELSEKSGISGGVFVHASGFIGGNQSKEGALQMAEQAV